MITQGKYSEDQLVAELWAQDGRFILGDPSRRPPVIPPVDLIAALAESHEARLQLSLIPLFLRHPEFFVHVNAAAQKLSPAPQLILKCFYSAAVWLEQKHLLRKELPDLFFNELGLSPVSNPDENLRALAKRQQELSGSHVNWLGTYEHAADVWLKALELQQAQVMDKAKLESILISGRRGESVAQRAGDGQDAPLLHSSEQGRPPAAIR